jgi:prepilin-type N-terminal cleavage/methylation domain-containing protein
MVALRSRIKSPLKTGFTLIELSIVLVIIGLIIGGVLVGQDLINTATIRAQISQLEKYQAAVNTFRGKYGYLPGDIPDPDATQFGFATRGLYAGEGDGNGLIEGIYQDAANSNAGTYEGSGETGMFWVDLSKAQMLDGGFNTAGPTTPTGVVPGNLIGSYLPQAKLGRGNFIYVWSGGWPNNCAGGLLPPDNINYFGISAAGHLWNSDLGGTTAMTVSEAYNIDNKIDDGLPQSGSITALYLPTGCAYWAYSSMSGMQGAHAANDGPTTNATQGTSATCYDNGNVAGVEKYSTGQNNGTGLNCALSIRFQ